MKEFKMNNFQTMLLKDNPIFSLITRLSGAVCFIMGIISVVLDMRWYISLLLFAGVLAAVYFLQIKRDSGKRAADEVVFLIIVYLVIIPLVYILLKQTVCIIPIYFIIGIMFTAVGLNGRTRIVMLCIEMLEYLTVIWYVTVRASDGVYRTAEISPDIYIRFLVALFTAGVAGGILFKYKEIILEEEISNGEEEAKRVERANQEKDTFMENMSHEIRIPLADILNTTDTLFDMNQDMQRKEDIYYIDNSARKLLAMTDRLMEEKADMTAEIVLPKRRRMQKFICPQAVMMVVDDNIINVEIVKSMLQQYQCKIVSALSGAECLKLLENNTVDIIFLDYMMPEMDGIETLKQIRDISGCEKGKLTVIALTAEVVSGAKGKFLEVGFDGYAAKPVETKVLENILEEYLAEEKIIEVEDEK